jgi:hypothetical protein
MAWDNGIETWPVEVVVGVRMAKDSAMVEGNNRITERASGNRISGFEPLPLFQASGFAGGF